MLTALEYLQHCEDLQLCIQYESIDRDICPDLWGHSEPEDNSEMDLIIDAVEEYDQFHQLGLYAPQPEGK